MNTSEPMSPPEQGHRTFPPLDQDIRPEQKLLLYYFLTSLLAGPFFFIPLLFLWFRYRTLTYRFDREGVGVRWGILFRREVYLTYTRVQDIHLTSNAVERWFELGKVKVQTASGSSEAEMTIEGLHEYEAVRDFLYSRMRGHDEEESENESPTVASEADAAILEAAADLKRIRELLSASSGSQRNSAGSEPA